MSLKICPLCSGTKQVATLGLMYSNCPRCEGVGYVKVKDKLDNEPVITYKKRGRRKKEELTLPAAS